MRVRIRGKVRVRMRVRMRGEGGGEGEGESDVEGGRGYRRAQRRDSVQRRRDNRDVTSL